MITIDIGLNLIISRFSLNNCLILHDNCFHLGCVWNPFDYDRQNSFCWLQQPLLCPQYTFRLYVLLLKNTSLFFSENKWISAAKHEFELVCLSTEGDLVRTP